MFFFVRTCSLSCVFFSSYVVFVVVCFVGCCLLFDGCCCLCLVCGLSSFVVYSLLLVVIFRYLLFFVFPCVA